ncbi:DNA polymerase I [Ruminococcus difficilis]|uniref:DNA polymerase I n=1 Tax=Ruminococcus difficilis TaxID=2763069 RepID=A0A934TZB4_9FIRM|nr:DNA polymerase I [Ruminococcus difficilis]MBK6087453.1 DNA polymerase I [Ruminococcus difficilis]
MKLLVVDGNSILNRAFYGIKPLTTKDGQFTNAIYGFLTMFDRMRSDVKPDAVAIAFDLKAKTFRHKAYDLYKANRKGMPEELHMQMAPLKELLTDLGYQLVTCEGYEADDILGTLSKACADSGNTCVIATGDRDSLQLVNDSVSVRLSKNLNGTMLYTPDVVKEEYGVEPKKLIEIKAIQGDSSDNIPGVAGIGPKGATELIQKYGDIDYIYDHLDELDIKPGMRAKLEKSKDNCFMSRMLGEICLTAPIDTELDRYLVGEGDKAAAARLMARLELFSLIKKYDLELSEDKVVEQDEQRTFKVVDADSETVDKILSENKELYVQISFEENNDSHPEGANLRQSQPKTAYISTEEILYRVNSTEEIKKVLSSGKKLYTDNSKPIFAYCDREGIEADIAFDTSLAAYLLSPSSSSYESERLCAEYSIPVATAESGEEGLGFIHALPALCKRLADDIHEIANDQLLYEIEIPLARVLARMENLGFMVDVEAIRGYGEQLGKEADELQASIYEDVGYEFNINSPKQLAKALFEDLNLPPRKKTKSGYSTNAEVLESLLPLHPVISKILEYRTVAKLKSTYCDSLIDKVADDGRIHSSFNQTETRTGRISSTEPNLQNIPVRTERGREFRRFFKAKDGCVLVDADYSQIELRVLAHMAGDETMRKAFTDNIDIHTVTASEVFGVPIDQVTPLMRSRAKAVNFGIVYGIGAFSLSKDIGVTVREAQKYIDNYLARFSAIDSYMKKTIEQAKADGYVSTLEGRRRYLPELAASNFNTRSFGERVARNAPIQGTAADIIKIAMVRVDERLKRESLEARLILQVHDELIVEAPAFESMQVAMLLQEEMENAVHLSVPLTAEASMGETWYEAKG